VGRLIVMRAGKNSCVNSANFDFPALSVGDGLVAQLVERLNGIEEVVSSILIESTTLEESPDASGPGSERVLTQSFRKMH
jgi:hypothetical protein